MRALPIIIISILFVLFLCIAVLVPFYEFEWKSKPSIPLKPKELRQVSVQPFFSAYFLNMKDVNGNSLQKMYELKTDIYGCVFTLDKNQSLIGIDGTNTFRNLREWTGGTLHETVPFINSIQHDVGIATDTQINSYLNIYPSFQTCSGQERGCYYIKTDSSGNPLGLYLGYVTNGKLVPIINKHYGFDLSTHPTTIFVFTQPNYSVTETVFTSAYDLSFGPYLTGLVTGTNMFVLRIPNFYMLNMTNQILSGGVIQSLSDFIPMEKISQHLNPGYSVVFYEQAKLFFGINVNKDCRLQYAPNDTRDIFSVNVAKIGPNGVSRVLQQITYNNITKDLSESNICDISVLIQGIQTTNVSDVIDLRRVFVDTNIALKPTTSKQCQIPTLKYAPILAPTFQTQTDVLTAKAQAELYSKLTGTSFFHKHELYIWIAIGVSISTMLAVVAFYIAWRLG